LAEEDVGSSMPALAQESPSNCIWIVSATEAHALIAVNMARKAACANKR